MIVKIIQSVRNEHVNGIVLYPVKTEQFDTAIANFYMKYKYIPNYLYSVKDQPECIYAVMDILYAGDGKEIDKAEQLYDIHTIENASGGLD